MAVGYTNGSLKLVEDGEMEEEEEFSHLSEQAATYMEEQKKGV